MNAKYKVEVPADVRKQIKKLPEPFRKRTLRVLIELETQPRPSGVKKLKVHKNRYRVRISDPRSIYEIEDTVLRVLVIAVAHRSEAY